MNQVHLFGGGGGGGDRKAKKEEYDRRRRAKRIENRICENCPAPVLPGNSKCAGCLEKHSNWVDARRANLIADGKCAYCGQFPIAASSKRKCVSCLKKDAEYNNARHQGEFGKWLNGVRTSTGFVSKGTTSKSPKYLDWTHEDFACRFVDHRKGNKRVIDHQIPLSCAELPGREVDWEFARVVAGLENLQLISSRANTRKGNDLDPIVLAKSKELRAQGLSGAPLFHRLWEEFSEAAQIYGDQSE